MSEGAFISAWEAAFEGLLLHERGRVVYLNPAAGTLLGVDRDRVKGKPLLFALRDHRLAALAASGGEERVELGGRILLVRAVPGALYLLDVTESERELSRTRLARELLAHELRTPVAGIKALLEALDQDPKRPERDAILDLVRKEVLRLERLVRGDPLGLGAAPWPLASLRERLLRLLPEAASVEFSLRHEVVVEEDAVFQILLNLVENALRYGKAPVSVTSEATEEGLRIEVRDAGPPLLDYERLFQPGQRGVHAASVRGSGLGLAIVRRIARGLGGDAYGRRVEGRNAFGVVLPAAVLAERHP